MIRTTLRLAARKNPATDHILGAIRPLIALGVVGALLISALPSQAAAPPSGWGTAAPIGPDGSTARDAQVAVSQNGNAVAVWQQGVDSWSNYYTPALGWGTATLIETNNAGPTWTPQVSIDAAGNAIAVWQLRAGLYSVWANRYVPGQGWGTETLLSPGLGGTFDPKVAGVASGRTLAVWSATIGASSNGHIWASWFSPSSGWDAPLRLDTSYEHATMPDVGLDAAGNAMVTWQQWDGTYDSMWAIQYVAARSSWGAAGLIETDDTGESFYSQVALAPNLGAFAVWEILVWPRHSIMANVYMDGAGWGGQALLETDDTVDAQWPQVAADDRENAMAVWQQKSDGWQSIWASEFQAESGWSRPVLVERGSTGDAQHPQVAFDGNGRAMAVWEQSSGGWVDIWANQFDPFSGWGIPTLLETDNGGDANAAQLAIDRQGNAVVVWNATQPGASRAWANRFVVLDTAPPPLSLAAPRDGLLAGEPAVWVEGTTEPGAQVSVNGAAATVEGSGSFGVLVPLQRGLNTLVVTASDDSGNRAVVSINVTFEDPLPGLRAQLAAAEANLSSALAEVANLSEDANSTQAQLAAAEEGAAAAQNQSRNELNQTRAQLTTVQTTLGATQTALEQTRSELSQARADYNATKAQTAAPAAGGDSSLGVTLGAVGIAVGALGIAMAARAGRKRDDGVVREPPKAP